jgi:hypothetical protein
VVFAVQVQTGSADGVIAVQTLWQTLLTHGTEAWSKALVQCRGANGSKSVVVTVQEFDSELCANPGARHSVILLTAEIHKNHDEFINTTVRVSTSYAFFLILF